MKRLKGWNGLTLGFLLMACGSASAQEQIPFEWSTSNNIIIDALINDADSVRLMFHTASEGLSLTKEGASKTPSVVWLDEVNVKSWGGESTARVSESNNVRIENVDYGPLSIWENKHSGHGTDGKFGPDVFDSKAINIDLDGKLIHLSPTVPDSIKSYPSLAIRAEHGLLFIQAQCVIEEDTINHEFLIHSGYSGAVMLDDAFAQSHDLERHITITGSKTLKVSYGNELLSLQGQLDAFVVGGTVIQNVNVGFFQGSIGQQSISVIGGELLQHFNIIIDERREWLYLAPIHG